MVHLKNPFKTKEKREKADFEKSPLSDYEVGQTLGEGGYGTVKRAHHKGEQAGVDVAIKIVPRSKVAPGRNDVKEITNRFHIMQALGENKHVIRLLEFRITKTYLFAFYEYCRGKDLFDRILEQPNGRFTEHQARIATAALADAVKFIHERGIMHRDIKPENCLYRTADGPFDDLVLADFGLSREVMPGEVIQGVAGSPGYWSVEMCRGNGYTLMADEWALGIVVYAMLSGRSPFRSLEADDLRVECAKGIITYPQKYWARISDSGKDFVQRLLQPNPDYRMTVAEALEHKWLTEAGKGTELSRTESPAGRSESLDRSETGGTRIERKPTHGLTPAGASLRFDKPPATKRALASVESSGSASHNAQDNARGAMPVGLSSESEETQGIDGMRVTTTMDVLKGSADSDQLAALATLDESGDATPNPTPIEGRSRAPSQADLSEELEHLKVDEGTHKNS